jgi:trehalose 6-phosphate synthase/phosphatase
MIVVSNRLPCVLEKEATGGRWTAKPASGGLVTAMEPVLRENGGLWIGWPGTTEKIPRLEQVLKSAATDSGYQMAPVILTAEERDQFYYGYSNEVIWPLFHDLIAHCNFDPAYWPAYQSVNALFAEMILKQARSDDFIWVHDYQLMFVAQVLRERQYQGRLAFFLHIPFPPLDIFLKLPKQQQLLSALLQFDLLGFQTERDERNFLYCVRRLVEGVAVTPEDGLHLVKWGRRTIRTGSFPIGIDFESFRRQAASTEVGKRAWNFHAGFPDLQLILGVDRLDYTKGIPDRMRAFSNALERYPELRGKMTLIQVVVPSRVDIPKYQVLKAEIEGLVGQINGRFSFGNWAPIHYLFRSLDFKELLAYYRTAEIALITPHKDGMNLVAKEYCACSIEEDCVLILSQFAGAADQLKRGALIINPYDLEQAGDALYQAFKMRPEERRARMQKLRRNIQKEDVFWWMDSFLKAAGRR